MRNDEEKLDRLLLEWECRLPEPPGLEREIWRRIAEREEAAAPGVPLAWLRQPWAGAAVAAVLFLMAALGGVGLAELQMQRSAPVSVEAREQAYFESLNPVALARHLHQP